MQDFFMNCATVLQKYGFSYLRGAGTTLLLALVLCLSMAACGSDGADEDNLYDVPDSFEGLVKDSEQMSNLYVYGGAWRGEDGSTMIVATSESGDEVRFAL